LSRYFAYNLCVQFMQIMFNCLNKVLILFLSVIFLYDVFGFISLTNYVQLILYTDILTVILKLEFGMLSVFA